jgi:polyribonucleotide nucleotidyltransferase
MHKRDLSLGNQTLSIETGRLAKQADGSVVVRMGDTMVLVTACHSSSRVKASTSFRSPSTIANTPTRSAASRRLLQARRQATEKETLTSRLIDRPIRPLFPTGWATRRR